MAGPSQRNAIHLSGLSEMTYTRMAKELSVTPLSIVYRNSVHVPPVLGHFSDSGSCSVNTAKMEGALAPESDGLFSQHIYDVGSYVERQRPWCSYWCYSSSKIDTGSAHNRIQTPRHVHDCWCALEVVAFR